MRLIIGLFAFCSPLLIFSQSTDEGFDNFRLDKGNVLISTNFSVSHNQGENQTLLIQPLDRKYQLNWVVSLRSGYFLKDNFVVGGLLGYSSRQLQLEYTQDGNPVKSQSLSREIGIAPFIRNYLPLGNGQFSLFNETNLQFTYGTSVEQMENSVDVSRTVGKSYGLRLGVQPGIMAFITKGISVEVGTSLLGLSTTYSTTEINGNEDNMGYNYSNDVSFKIDLLSLFLGITFYIPTK